MLFAHVYSPISIQYQVKQHGITSHWLYPYDAQGSSQQRNKRSTENSGSCDNVNNLFLFQRFCGTTAELVFVKLVLPSSSDSRKSNCEFSNYHDITNNPEYKLGNEGIWTSTLHPWRWRSYNTSINDKKNRNFFIFFIIASETVSQDLWFRSDSDTIGSLPKRIRKSTT